MAVSFLQYFMRLMMALPIHKQMPPTNQALQFRFNFGSEALVAGKPYISGKDTLSIDAFRCYISAISIVYDDHSSFDDCGYHLIDLAKPNSWRIPLSQKNKRIATVSFHIGVDSIASVSGAMSGDLDPANGMYWAWQSGYINMKVEGRSKSCPTRKNELTFHIGGYKEPAYAMRSVLLPIKANVNEPEIIIDLSRFFSGIDLGKVNTVMIPGKDAMSLADQSVKMFSTE